MGNGIGTGLVGDFHQALGDQRSGNRSTQQVFTFVNGIGAKHGIDEIPNELLAQIVDIDLLDAQRLRLGAGRLHFLTLPDIRGKRYDLAGVSLLQPAHDHRCIETTGIGQYNFINSGFGMIRHLGLHSANK